MRGARARACRGLGAGLVAAHDSSGLGPVRPAPASPPRLGTEPVPSRASGLNTLVCQTCTEAASSETQARPAAGRNFSPQPHSPTRVVPRFIFKGAALTCLSRRPLLPFQTSASTCPGAIAHYVQMLLPRGGGGNERKDAAARGPGVTGSRRGGRTWAPGLPKARTWCRPRRCGVGLASVRSLTWACAGFLVGNKGPDQVRCT